MLKNDANDANDASTVKLNNKFYRDGRKKLIASLFGSVIVIFMLSIFLLYIITHPARPKYFATSINGRIIPISALTAPNQSDSAVLQWATQAAIAVFTYNFVNYRDELLSASQYFTADGWRQFLQSLSDSENINTIKTKKLIVSAVATRAPIILQKGLLNESFSWRIQMPILVTYQSASEFMQQNIVVTLLVTRISTLESPKGIGISQFIVGIEEVGS